jgi:hypothetical protein
MASMLTVSKTSTANGPTKEAKGGGRRGKLC